MLCVIFKNFCEEEFFENKSSYYRMQLGFNVMFTPWLNLDVRYQTENGYYRDRYVATKYSYKMRHYINIVDTCLRGIDSILIEVHDAVRLVGRRREITSPNRLITTEECLCLVEVS